MITVAVDFDGTLVTHEYPRIGQEIPFAFDVLRRMQQDGNYKLILWTCRAGKLLDDAVAYCRERGVEFYAVNKEFPEEEIGPDSNRKIAADVYIDDRNLGGLPDWGVIYAMMRGETRPTYDVTYAMPQKRSLLHRLGDYLSNL